MRRYWYLVVIHLATTSAVKKTECLIDEKRGWFDPSNVYSCDDDARCCDEYGQPSCCKTKDSSYIIRDQLMLWGGLICFLTVIGLVVFCRRSDFYVMEGRSLCQRCCCCCFCCRNPRLPRNADVERVEAEEL